MNRTHLLAVCGVNRYGAGCKKCGHCVNGEQCDEISGNCWNGCEAGYYTTMMCEKGKNNNTTYTVAS